MLLASHSDEDADAIAECWNASLRLDPISSRTFARKVYLDANFRRQGLALAKVGGVVVGFCLSIARQVALEHDPPDDEAGYITAFGVRPAERRRGVATSLLERAEDYLRSQGKDLVRVSPYVPNYFLPGVDEAAYPEAAALLTNRGYRRAGSALAMDALLAASDPLDGLEERERRAAHDGVTVQLLRDGLMPLLFEFLRAETPADWSRHARELLRDGPPYPVVVAIRDQRVVGYCQYDGSHFGPFGVAESERGRGIGTLLLGRCLAEMKARGEHCAWVIWTGESAAPLYERFGFRRMRTFTIFEKRLAE